MPIAKCEVQTCAMCGVKMSLPQGDAGEPYPTCTGEKGPWFTRWVGCPAAVRVGLQEAIGIARAKRKAVPRK